MKRLFVLLMTVLMLVSFTGCFTQENIRGEQIVNNNTSASEGKEFDLGSVSGLTYENDFIGIGCTLPEGWTFYTDEQIKELNNYVDGVTTEDFKDAVKDAEIVHDMWAVSSDQTDNINVNMEKQNNVVLASMDLKETFENTIPIVKESLEPMGYTDIVCDVGTVEIDGEEFVCLNTTAHISGVYMYQKSVGIKCNGYLASVTVATFNEDTTDDILDGFYLVD